MLYADNGSLPICLDKIREWAIPEFAIKGGELIALGLPAGPMVAKTLQAVEAKWVGEDFPAHDRQAAIARQLVADVLLATKKA